MRSPKTSEQQSTLSKFTTLVMSQNPKMKMQISRLLACSILAVAIPSLAQERSPASKSAPAETKYLAVVRHAADVILENGRDNYGDKKSGMIISVLDATTGKPFVKTEKDVHGQKVMSLPQ